MLPPYDRRVLVRPDPSVAVMRVLHPCRCDAPDPEVSRMEPLDVPVGALIESGRYLAVCPECECRLLVVAVANADG